MDPSQSSDNNLTIGVPGWMKLAAGVPISGLLAWVIYMVMSGVTTNVSDISKNLSAHMAATEAMKATLDEQRQISTMMVNILRQSCVNAAKTQEARDGCFTPTTGR